MPLWAAFITKNNIMITAVAVTTPMIWQIRTCSVVDQPVTLEQIWVATERIIRKAIMPNVEANMRFIIDELTHKSPVAKPPYIENNLT